MPKIKTVEIEGYSPVTVRELSNRQIVNIINMIQSKSGNFESRVAEIIPICCDVAPDILLDMSPSELNIIIDAFMEVNETLINTAKSLNIDKLLSGIRDIVIPSAIATFEKSLNKIKKK